MNVADEESLDHDGDPVPVAWDTWDEFEILIDVDPPGRPFGMATGYVANLARIKAAG
jgi:hypothetical protein